MLININDNYDNKPSRCSVLLNSNQVTLYPQQIEFEFRLDLNTYSSFLESTTKILSKCFCLTTSKDTITIFTVFIPTIRAVFLIFSLNVCTCSSHKKNMAHFTKCEHEKQLRRTNVRFD